jgi:hypothetical protein
MVTNAFKCRACNQRWAQRYCKGLCRRCYNIATGVIQDEMKLGDGLPKPQPPMTIEIVRKTTVVNGVEYEIMHDIIGDDHSTCSFDFDE